MRLSFYEETKEKQALNDIDSAIYNLRSTPALKEKHENLIEILANAREAMRVLYFKEREP